MSSTCLSIVFSKSMAPNTRSPLKLGPRMILKGCNNTIRSLSSCSAHVPGSSTWVARSRSYSFAGSLTSSGSAQHQTRREAVAEFGTYVRANAWSIPNYGERFRAGEPISSALSSRRSTRW